MQIRTGNLVAAALAALTATALSLHAATPTRVMLLDGANNHEWKTTSPVILKILDETGLFRTTRVTVDNADLATFKPDWTQYDVVVLTYNTGIGLDASQWAPDVRASFQRYVSAGGGLVAVHAADNAFAAWPEFNEMIGVGGWGGRDERSGPYGYYRDNTLRKDETPGRAGSHGARMPFRSSFATRPIRLPAACRRVDASHRRAVCDAARPGQEHDDSGDRLLRPDQPGRADADGSERWQGADRPHDRGDTTSRR